jgi:methyl-accepting chemotaxis protein
MTDEPRASRRVLPPWTWPALDNLEQRLCAIESSVTELATDLVAELAAAAHRHDEQLAQMAGVLAQVHEMVATVNHRSAMLDEIAHLARHLDGQFNQVRDEVEIISALTLSLQRRAEEEGLIAPGAVPSA